MNQCQDRTDDHGKDDDNRCDNIKEEAFREHVDHDRNIRIEQPHVIVKECEMELRPEAVEVNDAPDCDKRYKQNH